MAQVATMALVPSLAWEILHDGGTARKKKKKKKKRHVLGTDYVSDTVWALGMQCDPDKNPYLWSLHSTWGPWEQVWTQAEEISWLPYKEASLGSTCLVMVP